MALCSGKFRVSPGRGLSSGKFRVSSGRELLLTSRARGRPTHPPAEGAPLPPRWGGDRWRTLSLCIWPQIVSVAQTQLHGEGAPDPLPRAPPLRSTPLASRFAGSWGSARGRVKRPLVGRGGPSSVASKGAPDPPPRAPPPIHLARSRATRRGDADAGAPDPTQRVHKAPPRPTEATTSDGGSPTGGEREGARRAPPRTMSIASEIWVVVWCMVRPGARLRASDWLSGLLGGNPKP